MIKRNQLYLYLTSFLLILIAAACGTAPPAVPTVTPDAGQGPPNQEGLPTATALSPPSLDDNPQSYPGAQPTAPPPQTREAGYPPPPTFPPTVDPYPGGVVWIIRPVGVQCEEGTVEGYGDLTESVATLTAAGLQVEDFEMTEIPVAAVCGGPTSAHYRVQVSPDDLDTARSMGWRRES